MGPQAGGRISESAILQPCNNSHIQLNFNGILHTILKFCSFETSFFNYLIQNFSGCFGTSGSMIPRLVPKISSLDAFCDGRAVAGAAVGIGDSRSWIKQ